MPVLGSPALSFLDTLCSQHTDCYQTFTRCVSLSDDAVHSAGEKGGQQVALAAQVRSVAPACSAQGEEIRHACLHAMLLPTFPCSPLRRA